MKSTHCDVEDLVWRPSQTILRPVHTGTNIGTRYSPAYFQLVFCVHTQAIFADDEPSEHALRNFTLLTLACHSEEESKY